MFQMHVGWSHTVWLFCATHGEMEKENIKVEKSIFMLQVFSKSVLVHVFKWSVDVSLNNLLVRM